jgi:hypothetical protein
MTLRKAGAIKACSMLQARPLRHNLKTSAQPRATSEQITSAEK